MSEYLGTSRRVRVRIKPGHPGFLNGYAGQECDAILYDEPVNPQIDSEQLDPPIPKWQTALKDYVEVVE